MVASPPRWQTRREEAIHVNRTPLLILLLTVLLLGSGCGSDAANTNSSTDASTGDALTDATTDATSDATKTPDPEQLRVLNYNVMCSICKNSDHPEWEQDFVKRAPWLRDVLQRHDADLIGVQELQAIGMKEGDPDEFSQILPDGYETSYYRHQPGDLLELDYPDAAIAWRKTRFAGLENGAFWLSPTPEKAFSTGFAKGGQLPRLVYWVRLQDTLSDRELILVNTHFDNNTPSQEKSAPLLLERLVPLAAKAPLVVVGDFNTRPGHPAYEALVGGTPKLTDTYGLAEGSKTPEEVVVSNVSPPPVWDVTDRIDHVLFHGGFEVLQWRVDLWRYGSQQQAPSDHPGAVVVDLRWPKP